MAKKAKVQFECQSCGYVSPKYLGRCPNCGQWNSMVEEVIQDTSDRRARVSLTGKKTQPQRLSEVVPKKEPRVKTELVELNRVLGGGVVPGSLVLIGGDPGIGKSTLLLQVSQQLAATGGTVLYVSGEESAEQIKLRAERLGTVNETFYLYAETDMHEISRAIEKLEPDYVIIDSIQTMTFRILRAVKNRFGSTNEIGIFEMQTHGLVEVMNPSQVFLEERLEGATGSSIVVAMEGSRPILVEIQALVTPTMFGNAKRTTTGLDFNRVSLIMAVLEKRAGLLLQNQDAYLKAAGGVKINEPAIDLALAISIASSYKEKGTSSSECFIGEIGLTGEIRRVNSIEQRVREAQKLGFTKVYVPKNNLGGWEAPEGIEIIGVSTIGETLRKVFK